MTAIADLIEQRAMIERQLTEASLPIVQAAQDLLGNKALTKLVADLQPIFDGLPPCESKTQIGYVLVVLTAVPNVLVTEAKRMTDVLAPASAPADPASTESVSPPTA